MQELQNTQQKVVPPKQGEDEVPSASRCCEVSLNIGGGLNSHF